MPEQTPSADALSSTAPAVVTVRPLRYADLHDVNAGDEEVVLYQLRDHAGVVTLNRSEIGGIATAPVYLRPHRRSPEKCSKPRQSRSGARSAWSR